MSTAVGDKSSLEMTLKLHPIVVCDFGCNYNKLELYVLTVYGGWDAEIGWEWLKDNIKQLKMTCTSTENYELLQARKGWWGREQWFLVAVIYLLIWGDAEEECDFKVNSGDRTRSAYELHFSGGSLLGILKGRALQEAWFVLSRIGQWFSGGDIMMVKGKWYLVNAN